MQTEMICGHLQETLQPWEWRVPPTSVHDPPQLPKGEQRRRKYKKKIKTKNEEVTFKT